MSSPGQTLTSATQGGDANEARHQPPQAPRLPARLRHLLTRAAATPDDRRALLLLAAGALGGLLLAGAGLFSSAAPQRVPAHAVALVNGKPILRSDWQAQVEVLQGEPWARTTPAQRNEALQSMIDEELFVQRGLELGLPDSDADVRAALAGSVRLQAGADQRAAALSEADLRAWFARHPERYGSDFAAAHKRLALDLRREQQTRAEQQLAARLREKSSLLIAPDAGGSAR
jgi:hypothetical protein